MVILPGASSSQPSLLSGTEQAEAAAVSAGQVSQRSFLAVPAAVSAGQVSQTQLYSWTSGCICQVRWAKRSSLAGPAAVSSKSGEPNAAV